MKFVQKLFRSNNYIPISKLQSGATYRIISRNSLHGIWIPESNGFIISRFKSNRIFPFLEYHWDINNLYGTVKPFEYIEQSPFEISYLINLLNSDTEINQKSEFHNYINNIESDDYTLYKFEKYLKMK